MYRVSAFGDWTGWLNFFFDATARACKKTVETINQIILLHEEYRARASEASSSSNLQTVVDMLFEVPVVRAREVVERAGITDAAARGLLDKLVELKMVEPYTGVYPRAWIAMDLIKLTTDRD